MRKELGEPIGRDRRELGEEGVGAFVDVAHEREVHRVLPRRQMVGCDVADAVVVNETDAGEVQPIEAAERNHRVVRIGMSRFGVHRLEQRHEALPRARAYRR